MNDFLDVAKIAAQIQRRREIYRLEYYKPYSKQLEFHHALGRGTQVPASQKMLMAANQFGKCATVRSYIDHPDGSRSTFGEMYKIGKPFPVFSWDGKRKVPALAVVPIKKPSEPCVRLWFSSGHWFECSLNHRMLASSGDYTFCETLLRSSSELCPSVHGGGVPRWTRIRLGFLAGCLAGLRLCDARLHAFEGIALVLARRLDDVLQRAPVLFGWGGSDAICTSTHQSEPVRLSSQGVFLQSGGRFFGSLSRAVGRFFRCTTASILASQRLVVGLVDRLLSTGEEQKHRVLPQACSDSLAGNRIIAYESIGSHEVYDFTVPQYQNYCSSGVVHHNTFCGAMEISMHATGRYPEWWKGKRFPGAVEILVGSNTNETARDICQRELLGDPTDEKRQGTGTLPIDCIGKVTRKAGVPNAIDSISVRHVAGLNSKIHLRAYEQGFKKFMGTRFDVGWCDEEPPLDIWSQMLRATFARPNAVLLLTLTPEEGMTQVVSQFVNDLKQGQSLVTATWDDAAHMTTEVKEQRLAALPPHEREMRSKGVPLMGSGLVFGMPDNELLVDPIEIPRHWPQVIGIDFGWDHPFGAAKLAWDRDSDIVYITADYRESKAVPAIHVASIKPWGDWIPVAWPHDGLNTEKGGGETLIQAYRDAGLNVLKNKATNPPSPGEAEGDNKVEPALLDMVERAQTGRLKVFKNCRYWMEEKRMYHRKDGKLVKMNDDVISASRYAFMMKRYAITIPVKTRRVETQGIRPW